MFKITLSDPTAAFRAALAADEKRVTKAALTAVKAAGDLAKARGRAAIAGGGFSTKWQNALRVTFYPDTPAAFVFHKIPYSDVFEDGITIAGKPYLWIALPIVQAASGRSSHAMTPSQFAAQFGDLVAVNVPGKAPMLFLRYQRGGGGRRGKRAVRAGYAGVPLYVGVPAITIAKKFDVTAAVNSAAAELPRLYDEAMGGEGSD